MMSVCSDERLWIIHSTKTPSNELTCVQTNCPPAPAIMNALMVGGNNGPFTVNKTGYYKCLDGYKQLGIYPLLTCTDNGTWSFPFFECLKIDCGLPQPINNAIVNTDNGTNVGSKAVFTCERGFYHATGQYTRICGSDGLWSAEFIECVTCGQEHCGDPSPIKDANVEIYSEQGAWTAIYSCNDPYEHSWSNSYDWASPLFFWIAGPVVECMIADCGDPPPVENSIARYNPTTVGRAVFYQCNAGYVATGNTIKKCTTEGKWASEPVVECVLPGTITCGSPPHILNSSRIYTSITTGSVANYTCNFGSSGEPFRAICGADGRWKLTEPFGCSLVACGAVPVVTNSASVRLSGKLYGDVVLYQCLEGYIHT